MLDIDDYKLISWKISKSMEDPFWVLKAKIDKHVTPQFFEKTKVTALDHRNVPHTVFMGIIPATDFTLKTADDKAEVIGYDYAWYLTVQHIPDSMETIDIDQNPSRTIRDLLGGADWEKTTGIEPYRINDVTAWDDATNPTKKQFTFKEQSLRWSAIVEIADYCNFVFVVKWREVSGSWRPCAYFIHEDDVDTGGIGLDLPPEMTVSYPDEYLVNDIEIKDEPLYKYNRVLCIGYSQETDEYFYSTAQTEGVAAGTEIPREYTYTEAALNTKDKTEAKAQELLDFFQASAITYKAIFNNRMDLELYQTLSIGGYEKIDSDEMRITAITYLGEAANNRVEIEFSKNQPIQQIKRLQRAMRTRIHYETFIDDMWEKSGAYAQLIEASPINFRGWGAYDITTIYGPKDADVGFWGWDKLNERGKEFARWRHHVSGEVIDRYLEIKQDIVIRNSADYQKLHFGAMETGKETFVGALETDDWYGLHLVAGGGARGAMLSLMNPKDTEDTPHLLLMRDTYITTNLTVGDTIKAWQQGEAFIDLKFYDARTGTKTLSDLAGAGLWVEARVEGEDFAQLKLDRAINMQQNRIRQLEHPEYDRDAATKWWVLQQVGGGELTNPMTEDLNMGNHDIDNCDDIDCDDIKCDDISADNINCGDIECDLVDLKNGGIYNVSHIDFWGRRYDDPPDNPTGGTIWYDGNNAVFKYYTGSAWKTITAT